VKKKILTSTLVLVCAVSMTSCSSSSSTDTTTPSDSTVPAQSSTSKVAAPIEINVTVGVDSSPDRVEEVPLGSEVNVRLLNPDADDNFHLHGYDLSPGDTPKGQTAVITFTADDAGDFEIESHVTEKVLIVISVK
jgi:hypothetical protein